MMKEKKNKFYFMEDGYINRANKKYKTIIKNNINYIEVKKPKIINNDKQIIIDNTFDIYA